MYDDANDTFTIVDEWGCRGSWIWLDASLILFDKSGNKVGEVDYNDKKWGGGVITHSGDKQDEKKAHGSSPSSRWAIPTTRSSRAWPTLTPTTAPPPSPCATSTATRASAGYSRPMGSSAWARPTSMSPSLP